MKYETVALQHAKFAMKQFAKAATLILTIPKPSEVRDVNQIVTDDDLKTIKTIEKQVLQVLNSLDDNKLELRDVIKELKNEHKKRRTN